MDERILLVEGLDDQHVMWNLFKARDVPQTFQVKQPRVERDFEVSAEDEMDGGDKALLKSMVWWLLRSGLECLAVVMDADDKGPEARWQSIRTRLLNQGYHEVPKKHSDNGTVFELSLRPQTPRSVRFGVWIMPDNRSKGMIEDFVMQLIREDDEMLHHVDHFLEGIPADHRRFKEAHQSKARIRAWLAVGEKPGRPMGQAIKADKQLDANSPTVQPFLEWITSALITDGQQP